MGIAVKKVGEKYYYNICGNEVIVTKIDGGTVVCCGPDVELVSLEGRKEGASGK
jgi:hypothetical protein